MNLRDLKAKFVVNTDVGFHRVDEIAQANGVFFRCPKCYMANGNTVIGTHSVLCWSRSSGAPENISPGPGRWKMEGTGIDDLTLNADAPSGQRSVQLSGDGCGAHFHVTNGEIQFC